MKDLLKFLNSIYILFSKLLIRQWKKIRQWEKNGNFILTNTGIEPTLQKWTILAIVYFSYYLTFESIYINNKLNYNKYLDEILLFKVIIK